MITVLREKLYPIFLTLIVEDAKKNNRYNVGV